jgi:hypothetical protein
MSHMTGGHFSSVIESFLMDFGNRRSKALVDMSIPLPFCSGRFVVPVWAVYLFLRTLVAPDPKGNLIPRGP